MSKQNWNEEINTDKGQLSPRKINKIISLGIILIVVGAIVGIALSVFIPSSEEGFTEMSILMYNETTDSYEASGYPTIINSNSNASIFFMIKNFENKVMYYQVQIKVTKLTQDVSAENPVPLSFSHLLYPNDTFEKILSSASNKEKKETGVFSGEYIWEPVNVSVYINGSVEPVLGGQSAAKIILELWEFNTATENFHYSGIFTFLEVYHFT